MNTSRLFADGQELVIEKIIGKGGEGEVYSLSNMPGYVMKAYLPGLAREREGKIRAMVNTRLSAAASTIAFPYQVVVNAKGEFVGFMMRLVEKHKEIHELQTPSSRHKHFPNADYRFLVRTAVNIARVFSQAHAAGCIVGDINQRGILVSPTATVALIDADSFQIPHNGNRYLCVVGVPEYTPPELQGKSLKSIVRTHDHDAFGLAVSLFQLLCMDRHPFSGRYAGGGDMPLEKAIAEFRFAYSTRSTGMLPPPGTVRLNDFPPNIRECFEQSFSPQHVGRRPSPSRWVSALEELEASLRVCARSRLHHYSRHATECPWCRMESEYGRPLFLSADVTAVQLPKGRVDEKLGLIIDVHALLAAVNGIPIPTSISVPVPTALPSGQPSKAAVDAAGRQKIAPIQRAIGLATIVGACILFLGYQIPFIAASAIGAFGAWLAMRSSDPAANLLATHKTITDSIQKHVQDLQSKSPIERVLERKAEVLDAIDDYKALSTSYGRIQADYDQRRMQQQLEAHLSNRPIRGARIPKLSSADVAALASYGIGNALEVKRRNVQQVYGIGPVKHSSMAAWVKRMEASFKSVKEYTQDDLNNIRKAQLAVITKQQGLEEKCRLLVDKFKQELAGFEAWRTRGDSNELKSLVQQLGQVEADIRHLQMQVPVTAQIPPYAVPPIATFRGQRAKGGSFTSSSPVTNPPSHQQCPRCQNYMIKRFARQGRNAGRPFWGCSQYPSCTGTRPI